MGQNSVQRSSPAVVSWPFSDAFSESLTLSAFHSTYEQVANINPLRPTVRQPNIYADTAILQNCGKILATGLQVYLYGSGNYIATGPHNTTGNYKNKTPLHLTKQPQSLITQILVNWQACKSAKKSKLNITCVLNWLRTVHSYFLHFPVTQRFG